MEITKRVKLADRYIKNANVRNDFRDNVQHFIDLQLRTIRSTNSESQRQQCITNLQQERDYLDRQDRQLSLSSAKIVVTAQLVQKNGVWGYIINGVGILLSSMQTLTGAAFMLASMPSGNMVSFVFGGMLVLHGINGIQESYKALRKNSDSPDGLVKDAYISTAEFMGFDGNTGRLAYSYMDLTLSGYGMLKLTLSPQAWRLFYFLRSDYVRTIKTMSKWELAIEMYQDHSAIQAIYESK